LVMISIIGIVNAQASITSASTSIFDLFMGSTSSSYTTQEWWYWGNDSYDNTSLAINEINFQFNDPVTRVDLLFQWFCADYTNTSYADLTLKFLGSNETYVYDLLTECPAGSPYKDLIITLDNPLTEGKLYANTMTPLLSTDSPKEYIEIKATLRNRGTEVVTETVYDFQSGSTEEMKNSVLVIVSVITSLWEISYYIILIYLLVFATFGMIIVISWIFSWITNKMREIRG